jgi:hypothetical protein
MSNRTFIEKLVPFTDGTGYDITIKVELVDGAKPCIIIESCTRDSVIIQVEDWEVVKDAIDRGVSNVGDHADEPSPPESQS